MVMMKVIVLSESRFLTPPKPRQSTGGKGLARMTPRLFIEEISALRARREEIISDLHWASGRYSQEQKDRMLDERSALDKVLAPYPEKNDRYIRKDS